MTKQVNAKNQIWYEQQDNVVTIGFTKEFLESLDQCWHIVPANMERFREHAPLMVIETNDQLISIKSPVAANFTSFNPKAQNFPDQLTEDDVILEMRAGAAVRRPREVVRENGPINWDAPQNGFNPAPELAIPVRGAGMVAGNAAAHADLIRRIQDQQLQAAPAIRRGRN